MTTAPGSDQGSEFLGTASPAARRTLALLLTIGLFNYIDRYVLAAVVPEIRREFFGDEQDTRAILGMLATAFMVSYMLLAPVFGWLADRRSRWPIMGFAVIVWSLASGASGWAPTFLFLLVSRCFMGFAEAAYGPAAPTVLADMFPRKNRGQALALFYLAIPVGSALGYALGGVMVWLLNWRWAFYFDMPIGLALGLLCFWMPEPRRGQSDAASVSPAARLSWSALRVFWRTPSFVLNTIGMTAMTFALGGIAFWIPDYIYEDRLQRSVELHIVTIVFGSITVVAGLSATLLGGYLADRLQPRYPGSYFLVSGLGMLLGFVAFLLFLIVPFPWAWILVFIGVFFLFFNTGPANTILVNVIPPPLRSTGFALNIFFIHAFGDAVSPFIIGAIADRSSLTVGFFVVSGMMLLSAVFWLWGARYLGADAQRAIS